MAEIVSTVCVICGSELSGETVSVSRGLKTLIEASFKRKDDLDKKLSGRKSVLLHATCRKDYTRPTSIAKALKSSSQSKEATNNPRQLRSSDNIFDFKQRCLFCGEIAKQELEIKKPIKYRKDVIEVRTINVIDTIKKHALELSDERGSSVLSRIGDTIDLVAAEARYHSKCYVKFLKCNFFKTSASTSESDATLTRPEYSAAALAFNKLCDLITSSDECQYTVKSLYEKLKEFCESEICYSELHMRRKLTRVFGAKMTITDRPPKPSIATFLESADNLLLDSWYNQRKDDLVEERKRIVEAAATIIREDIRSRLYDLTLYSNETDILNGSQDDIPETLRLFVEKVTKSTKRKCISIEHAIISAARPRSFISSLQVGLAVHLHRNYASRQLIDILCHLGFCASYNEVLRYERAVIGDSTCTTIDSNAYVQFVFDNADFNIRTLDGLGTFHSMGGIKCVTPSHSVKISAAVKRVSTPTLTSSITDTGKITPLVYKKPNESGLKKIVAKDLFIAEDLANHFTCSKIILDLLWALGSTVEKCAPGWNGYMLKAFSHNTRYETTKVIPVPFITMDPGNLTTIYTALMFAINEVQKHNQDHCIVTFDQPLYIKAMEMVFAAEKSSPLSKIIPRLGGFHLLMSFMGTIGNIMAGSGLEELWCVMYAKSSVDHMLSGHAYARALRANSLTQLALFSLLIEYVEVADDELEEIRILYKDFMENNANLDDIDVSHTLLSIQEKLGKVISNLKKENFTAMLWLQYYEQVALIRQFIRAERTGDWTLHLKCIREMLPYFHAAAHLPYAKAAQIYVQHMEDLGKMMSVEHLKKFVEGGFFTVRRSDRYWAGIWTDMTIEQILMRSMKATGGLTHGRGITDSTLSTWINAMPACIQISDAIEQFSGIVSGSSDQHVELRDSRQSRDKEDTGKLIAWLRDRNPFSRPNKSLISLASGMVADETINCHQARQVGLKSMQDMIGKDFAGMKLKRKDKVKTLASMNNGIKVRDEIIVVNSQQLFNRITCVMGSSKELRDYMAYELAPRPPSLFDDFSMRKGNKASLLSALVDLISDENEVTTNNEPLYVVDGGHLLHKVLWPKPATYKDVIGVYISYLLNHYSSRVTVVFDGYNVHSTKSMEHLRRSSKNISMNVEVKENMFVSTTQANFLNNSNNKKQLIKILRERLQEAGINSCEALADADRLIVTTAIALAQNVNVVVVAEDTDVVVVLIALARNNSNLYFLKPGSRSTNNKLIKIAAFEKHLGEVCQHLMFIHAVTGCDTTSALFGKGKKMALKLLQGNKTLMMSMSAFNEPDSSHEEISRAGESFLTSFYGGKKQESLNHCRYFAYNKSIARLAVKSAFDLAKLPPTSEAAKQHSFRVYHQIQQWRGNDIPPEEWGWKFDTSGNLSPIPTLLAPAPDHLLNLISCGCKKRCVRNCECKKAGLFCTAMCGHCRGNDCENIESILDEFIEEYEEQDRL